MSKGLKPSLILRSQIRRSSCRLFLLRNSEAFHMHLAQHKLCPFYQDKDYGTSLQIRRLP
jgi:hypothetical protein